MLHGGHLNIGHIIGGKSINDRAMIVVRIHTLPRHWLQSWRDGLHHICALQFVSGEGMDPSHYYCSAIDAFASNDMTNVKMPMVIRCLQTTDMTLRECSLHRMTCCNPQCLPNWPKWDAAFDAQLDVHVATGTFRDSVPWPTRVDSHIFFKAFARNTLADPILSKMTSFEEKIVCFEKTWLGSGATLLPWIHANYVPDNTALY